MARKTAIRITNAELAAETHRLDARRDATPIIGREPTTLDVIRAARDMMTDAELLKLAQSAARLELRGESFDAEDRADCAAETVWHILAETGGCPPRRSSEHATLTYLCGLASNWRRALIRRRAAEDRARIAAEDRYTASSAAVLDEIEMRTFDADYLAAADRQLVDRAHQMAADAVDRLELPRGGTVYAAIYQWARDRTAEVCAADNGVKLSAWKMRVKRGGEMIRAAYPDPIDLIDALTDRAELPAVYRGVSLDWKAREGTDAGSAPIRPQTAQGARELCQMRHQCPTPGLAAIGAARIRRGFYLAAPNVGWSPTSAAPRGFIRVPGKSAEQLRADALRKLARESARRTSRERGVTPREIKPASV